MVKRVLILSALFMLLQSLLQVGLSQKVFRDTSFSDSCLEAEGKISEAGDVVVATSCFETGNYWFTIEVERLFEVNGVRLNYNFDANGRMDRVVLEANGVTMRYLSNVRSTFNQVYGTARLDITSRYTLSSLQEPDADTGVANRRVAEWVREDGVTVQIYAGVPPLNPKLGVTVVVIYDRPNPDAWQF